MRKVTDIPHLDRPRERLLSRGAQVLSNQELLAVILGSGTKENDVLKLAKRALNLISKNKGEIKIEQFLEINGIGEATASKIMAVLEFSTRHCNQGLSISKPSEVLNLVTHLQAKKQEHFVVVSLNGAQEVIDSKTVAIGLVNRCEIHPREVFADAIEDRASAIIVAHNHPASNLKPSKADIEVTKILKSAGELLGIPLLDHLIFNAKGYFSFRESGIIWN